MCCSGWIKLVGGDHHGKEAGVAAFSTFALQIEVEDSAEPRLFTEEEMVTMDNEDKEERDMEDFRELQLRVEKKVSMTAFHSFDIVLFWYKCCEGEGDAVPSGEVDGDAGAG